ncbi:MAG: TIGR02757 family protein [Kiritimatiellae bacterium]|jgi:uncharacterized protein (TIGR02757 family)|nr:TIGR02757 family protein [Kiritimatiellia bacterium]
MSQITTTQLEQIYDKYNKFEFVSPDPLECLYRYEQPLDIEFVGFISAAFAFGRVSQILKTLDVIFSKLGDSPQQFILNSDEASLKEIFRGFKYRFVKEDELICTLLNMQKIYKEHGSLENCFHSCYSSSDETLQPAIIKFIEKMKCGGNYLIPKANTKGACKRLNLFLRWMVRDDHVDLGLWKTIPASKLIIPLDTHIANISKHFGFTKRSTSDMKMALEITNAFKKFAPTDPTKYDFSLTRFGIRDDMSIRELKNEHKSL